MRDAGPQQRRPSLALDKSARAPGSAGCAVAGVVGTGLRADAVRHEVGAMEPVRALGPTPLLWAGHRHTAKRVISLARRTQLLTLRQPGGWMGEGGCERDWAEGRAESERRQARGKVCGERDVAHWALRLVHVAVGETT